MAEAKPTVYYDLLGSLDEDQDNGLVYRTTFHTGPPNKGLLAGDTEKNEELLDLRQQVNHLENTVSLVMQSLNPNQKPLLKPRDIAQLELRHLRGEEGEGRLGVFFSQVEQCSQNWEERKRIVLSRSDPQLAVYIQDIIINRQLLSWDDFKLYLRKELTDQNQNRLFDALNDLRYSYQDNSIEFMNKL